MKWLRVVLTVIILLLTVEQVHLLWSITTMTATTSTNSSSSTSQQHPIPPQPNDRRRQRPFTRSIHKKNNSFYSMDFVQRLRKTHDSRWLQQQDYDTVFNYTAFWSHACDQAMANQQQQLLKEEEKLLSWPNKKCPKVYIYQLPPSLTDGRSLKNDAKDKREWLDMAFGPPLIKEDNNHDGLLANSFLLRDTNMHSFPQILDYRLRALGGQNNSNYNSCVTTNPNEADLFWIPIHPQAKNWNQWRMDTCGRQYNATETVQKILEATRPYLNASTACRHFVAAGKGHAVLEPCQGWWSHPDKEFKHVMRLAYSHTNFIPASKGPHAGMHMVATNDTAATYPHLFSVPFPSSLHWTRRRRRPDDDDNDKDNDHHKSGERQQQQQQKPNEPNENNNNHNNNTFIMIPPPWTVFSHKNKLMSFVGTDNHGDVKARKTITKTCRKYNNDEICHFQNPWQENQVSWTFLKQQSVFCLEPMGDDPWRKSLSDSITFGCIPVLLSSLTDNVAPWSWGHWKQQGRIVIPRRPFVQNKIDLYTLLVTIPPKLLRLMQQTLRDYGRQFQYSLDDDPEDGIYRTLHGLHQQAMKMEQAGICTPTPRAVSNPQ